MIDLDDSNGQVLGQYTVYEALGQGGMATVYRAVQTNLNREVALKILPPQLAEQAGYRDRFIREAHASASFDHPNIAPIYDYGVQDDLLFITMRYLRGGTLEDRLYQREKTNTSLPTLPEAIAIIQPLASALEYAHSKGVIHRDIKATNIMFDEHGTPYVTDFGLAKVLDATSMLTESGVALGTPTYMSPEQWRGLEVTSLADQYALGILLFVMLAGMPPFKADNPYSLMTKHMNDALPQIHDKRPDLPVGLQGVLEKATAKEPHERYVSVSEFAQAVSLTLTPSSASVQPSGFFTMPVTQRKVVRPAQTAAELSQRQTITDVPVPSPIPSGSLPNHPTIMVDSGGVVRDTSIRTRRGQWVIVVVMIMLVGFGLLVASGVLSGNVTDTSLTDVVTTTPQELSGNDHEDTLPPLTSVAEIQLTAPEIALMETSTSISTLTPRLTATPSITATPTTGVETLVAINVAQQAALRTATAQAMPTDTPTLTHTSTATSTPTLTLTSTPTMTLSPTATPSATLTSTATPTVTSTATLIPTSTATPMPIFTHTPRPTETSQPTQVADAMLANQQVCTQNLQVAVRNLALQCGAGSDINTACDDGGIRTNYASNMLVEANDTNLSRAQLLSDVYRYGLINLVRTGTARVQFEALPIGILGRTTSASVNVRTNPSSNGAIVMALPASSAITLLGRNDTSDWVQIAFVDEDDVAQVGWIAAFLLVDRSRIAGLPIASDSMPSSLALTLLASDGSDCAQFFNGILLTSDGSQNFRLNDINILFDGALFAQRSEDMLTLYALDGDLFIEEGAVIVPEGAQVMLAIVDESIRLDNATLQGYALLAQSVFENLIAISGTSSDVADPLNDEDIERALTRASACRLTSSAIWELYSGPGTNYAHIANNTYLNSTNNIQGYVVNNAGETWYKVGTGKWVAETGLTRTGNCSSVAQLDTPVPPPNSIFGTWRVMGTGNMFNMWDCDQDRTINGAWVVFAERDFTPFISTNSPFDGRSGFGSLEEAETWAGQAYFDIGADRFINDESRVYAFNGYSYDAIFNLDPLLPGTYAVSSAFITSTNDDVTAYCLLIVE